MPSCTPPPERQPRGKRFHPPRLLGLWAALLLGGCIPQYKMIPPGDTAGIQCVSQCNQIQADCKNRAIDRAEQGRAQCERDAEIEYMACLKYSKGEDLKKCSRNGCYVAPDTYGCDSAYHSCFESCGGTIIRIN